MEFDVLFYFAFFSGVIFLFICCCNFALIWSDGINWDFGWRVIINSLEFGFSSLFLRIREFYI